MNKLNGGMGSTLQKFIQDLSTNIVVHINLPDSKSSTIAIDYQLRYD